MKTKRFISLYEIFGIIYTNLPQDVKLWNFESNDYGFFWVDDSPNYGKIGMTITPEGTCEIYTGINTNIHTVINLKDRTIEWRRDTTKSLVKKVPRFIMYDIYVQLCALIQLKTNDDESKITEGEKEMENENNYIKMDGEKDSFEGGAIRYTKNGKGRYDLIPSQQIHDILDYAKLNWGNIVGKDDDFCSIHNVLISAYPDADDLTYDNYIEIIINIVRYSYIAAAKNQIFDAFMMGFVKMLKDLAVHYEMGAEKYGVDNWKNGIPETKGERGGSFRDSGLRHLQQLLDGKTDEPHQIAAIWNFVGAMYVRKHQNDNTEEHTNLKEVDIENSSNDEITEEHTDLKESDIENQSNDEITFELPHGDITIDLSHPDLSFGNICVIFMAGNEFNVSFGTDNTHIQAYSFDRDKISVSRSTTYSYGMRRELYTITGMNSSHEHIKIDLLRTTSLDDESGKSSIQAKIYKGFHMTTKPGPQCIFFKVEHESYPRPVEDELWDKLYDDEFKDIVADISPV